METWSWWPCYVSGNQIIVSGIICNMQILSSSSFSSSPPPSFSFSSSFFCKLNLQTKQILSMLSLRVCGLWFKYKRWSFLVSVEPLCLSKEGQRSLTLSILFLHKLYLLFLWTFPSWSSKTHRSCQLKALVVFVVIKLEAKNLSFLVSPCSFVLFLMKWISQRRWITLSQTEYRGKALTYLGDKHNG